MHSIMLIMDGKRRPYTLKEIVELDYPDFWGGANECVRVAKELQNMMLEMLPVCKKYLPGNFDQLKEKRQTHPFLLDYIKLRSTYGLACALWELTDSNCRKLAQAKLDVDQDKIKEAQQRLIDVMSFFDSITKSLDYVSDAEKGFDRLKDMIDAHLPGMDFFVMKGVRGGTWSYRDIVGTICSKGLLDESLCNSVIADEVPTESNIPGLMEREEDNEMVIMY